MPKATYKRKHLTKITVSVGKRPKYCCKDMGAETAENLYLNLQIGG